MNLNEMITGYAVTGGICLLLLLFGLTMLKGKGAMLIAGYNTMPKHKREKYDEKALCRFVGKLLISMVPCLALTIAGEYFKLAWLVTGPIVLSIVLLIGGVIYVNTGNRFKNN